MYHKSSTKRPGTTGALTPKIWILMIFSLSPGLIYCKDIENMKFLKAKYGHPFVYKPHNLCLDLSPCGLCNHFDSQNYKWWGHYVFYIQYVVISPYKTRSQIRLWLRSLGWRFLSMGCSYQPIRKF